MIDRDLAIITRRQRAVLLIVALAVGAFVYCLNRIWSASPISDGGSHYVTGLLAYDWLHAGKLSNPIQYGTEYFRHLPYIGLLLWPPLFYGIEMVAFTIFGPSIKVAMMLGTVILAACAAVFGAVLRKSGRSMSVCVAVASTILTSTLIQDVQRNLLIDGLVSLLTILALFQFADYLIRPTWRRAAASGVWAVLAFYAKGNALLLGLAFPLLALMLRRPRMLVDRRTLVMAAACIVATAPWLYLTAGLSAQGFLYSLTAAALFELAGSHLHTVFVAMPVLALFAIVGAFAAIKRSFTAGAMVEAREVFSSACLSLVIACIVFHTVIPAGSDPRYMFTAVFGSYGLAVTGLEMTVAWLLDRMPRSDTRLPVALMLGVLTVQAIVGLTSSLPIVPNSTAAIASVAMQLLPENNRSVLISADHNVETSVGPALAALDGKRRASKEGIVVVRGSRAFAGGAYRNRDYQAKFKSEAEYAAELTRLGVPVIIAVTPKPGEQWGHIAPIQNVLNSPASDYVKTAEQKFFGDQLISVWRRKDSLTHPINFETVSESNNMRERVSKVVK